MKKFKQKKKRLSSEEYYGTKHRYGIFKDEMGNVTGRVAHLLTKPEWEDLAYEYQDSPARHHGVSFRDWLKKTKNAKRDSKGV